MKVTKFSGELVLFDKEKLQHSLRKSGADENAVLQVMHEIDKQLYEGIPTKKIYKPGPLCNARGHLSTPLPRRNYRQ